MGEVPVNLRWKSAILITETSSGVQEASKIGNAFSTSGLPVWRVPNAQLSGNLLHLETHFPWKESCLFYEHYLPIRE